jgi:hypothetical protein
MLLLWNRTCRSDAGASPCPLTKDVNAEEVLIIVAATTAAAAIAAVVIVASVQHRRKRIVITGCVLPGREGNDYHRRRRQEGFPAIQRHDKY